MGNADEPLDSQTAPISAGMSSSRKLTAEALATLLLRLLGVYYAVWGIVGGVGKAGTIILAANRISLELALAREWVYLLRPIMELVAGLYFLLGGQWVFEKVLTPITRHAADERS